MLNESGLGQSTIRQHEIVIATHSQCRNGMGVVDCLNAANHDKRFALRYQLLDIFALKVQCAAFNYMCCSM